MLGRQIPRSTGRAWGAGAGRGEPQYRADAGAQPRGNSERQDSPAEGEDTVAGIHSSLPYWLRGCSALADRPTPMAKEHPWAENREAVGTSKHFPRQPPGWAEGNRWGAPAPVTLTDLCVFQKGQGWGPGRLAALESSMHRASRAEVETSSEGSGW